MSKSLFSRSRRMFGLVMVVATITLAGVVAFRFLAEQDNTQVATQPAHTEVAKVESVKDVETVTQEVDSVDAELSSLDAELDSEFSF